jgi:soluble lytic murein transglycosylase
LGKQNFIILLGLFFGAAAITSGHPAATPSAVRIPTASVQQAASENALASARRSDASARDANGKLLRLTPAEHMRRASIYMGNRAFEEARQHWQALIDYYPQDPRVPEALLGMGKSFFQSRYYSEAYATYDRLARSYGSTKEGREGLNFSAAALLRLGKFSEAADRYIEYINRYPTGERIDTAHLNVIDTLREADKSQEAIAWIARTRLKFAGTPTDTNALFALLRLSIAEGNWREASSTADQLAKRSFPKAVQTSPAEVSYLKAFSLEQAGKKEEAFAAYLTVADGVESYYGWLATERLLTFGNSTRNSLVTERVKRVHSEIASASEQYPAPYRLAIVRAAKDRKLDPRFILALIRQESVFRPLAKSPSGARGLLQLTIDAAQKYAAGAGLDTVRETQLYQPETSIMLGAEYLSELAKMFPQMLEAVAASYNGGEDNVARWVKRAKRKDPGVLTSEIGFDETKAYVQKVMANYRVYRELYSADLTRR